MIRIDFADGLRNVNIQIPQMDVCVTVRQHRFVQQVIWKIRPTPVTLREHVSDGSARGPRVHFLCGLIVCISSVLACDGAVLAQSKSSSSASEQAPVIDTPPRVGEELLLPPQVRALYDVQPLRLLFQSKTEGVSFHLRLGATYRDIPEAARKFGLDYQAAGYPVYSGEVATGYAPICETPCVATLVPGTYRMALALDEGYPLDVETAVHLEVDSVVEGRYVDKRRMRRAGAMFGLVALVAGTVMMLVAVDFRDRRGINYPVLYTGVGLASAGLIIGLPLSNRDDEVEIDVHPLEQ